MMRKILVANRGEIAVRIIRGCRDLGISPVAIYSEADRCALHLRMADEAYCLGPSAAHESYLRIDKIIDIAGQAGAEAIHPGYGFLAENPAFAKAVEEAGLIFIGPSWQTIADLGDKTKARHIAKRAQARLIPGLNKATTDLDEVREKALEVGYPILLKAAAGGGGKGMRQVSSADELESAFRLAQSEAVSAFGNGALYFEKYMERPRHIEIQILGDRAGHMIHLGERECSIQRRHQKVIEECPSPLNDETLRHQMGAVAVGIAKQAGYYNAGTVEFLVDEEKNFYFLEMNTRLQVEHPVTEMVTGIDLVRQQLRIAAGEPLALQQDEIQWRGAAIECRIYAEDPEQRFMPCPGRILRLRSPSGPGIREDSGVFSGSEVPLFYDPLLSKLVAWGRTRAQAIDRMRRALDEYELDGIKTTIPLYQEILRDAVFQQGALDTGYIERFWKRRQAASPTPTQPAGDAVMIAGALHYAHHKSQMTGATDSSSGQSAWKLQGRQALLNRRR